MPGIPETTEPDSPRSNVRSVILGFVVIVLAILAVIVVLSVLGPATSTLYSNVMIDL